MMDKLKFTHIPTNTLTKKLNKTIDKVNNKFKGNYISKKRVWTNDCVNFS